jgi:ABC-2 type transport system permease protein
VLATRVGRIRWAFSHLALAVSGVAVVLISAGLMAGLVHGLRTGDVGGQAPPLIEAALVQLPAALVLAGLALALFGLAPHLTALSWGALVAFLLLAQLGPTLQLDQSVMNISPFTHVPERPGGELTVKPLLWLSGVAAALVLAGLIGFRSRDIG